MSWWEVCIVAVFAVLPILIAGWYLRYGDDYYSQLYIVLHRGRSKVPI